jgi:TonB family protein
MSTESHTTGLQQGLLEAQDRAENGEYQLAINSIRSVKSDHPRNIYVLAFEKQLEQLHQLTSAGQLSEEQKLDILESLPGIVERALDGQGAELSTGQTAVYKPLTQETIRQKDEKSAALEWLKNQYFQHAHEYVRKGEYDNALAEIRRVFIIEPSNKIAQDFESQIRQLSQLKRARQAEPPPPPPPPVPRPPAPAPAAPPVPVVAADPQEEVVVATPEPHRPPPAAPVVEQPKQRMSNWVVLAILLTIAVIGAAVFYFIVRPHKVERIKYPSSVSPTGDAIFSPPTTTEERTYVISGNPTEQIAATETPPVESVKQTSGQEQRDEKPAEPKREEAVPTTPPRSSEPLAANSGPNAASLISASLTQNQPPATQGSPDTQAPQEEPPADPFIVVEQPPQIVKLEKPRFSDAAYKQGLEGQVVVQVQIDPQGRPQQAKVLTSSNSMLEEGVLDAVLRSQFVPGRMSNGPVASSLVIPFKFRR